MPERSSRTAEFVALFRALESRLPERRRLFDDPYAASFLGPRLRATLALARVPVTGALVPEAIDRGWPGTRVSVVVRTRYIDDAVAGAEQVVILGAGFDTRALRLGLPRVVELDEPATQALKRERIGRLPANLTLAPIDFEREPLAGRLPPSGAGTVFVWEGVTSYLTSEAVDATLRTLASAAGARVVFTYLDRGTVDEIGAAARTVRRVGEPFNFGFDPAELPAYLAERNLELIEDVSAAELTRRYLHPLDRRPKASAAFRIAHAVVG